ncbi:hypothetical protein [Celeribacter halophilus]|jgi:hypothetical protein|uniref:hypothetical protein n=1 Tax=Celeribacter halophilus TaxID=576117 RepID=UPI002FD3685F
MSDLNVTPSPMRRVSAVAMLGVLGILLLRVALGPEALGAGWVAMLLVFAAAVFWVSWRLWEATACRLVLTEEELVEEGLDGARGRVLCRLDDIAGVERGTFAFKPSNGFMIRLKTPASRVWAPGLWWRFGKRVGVGGVTPAGQGKAMADVIAARIGTGARID